MPIGSSYEQGYPFSTRSAISIYVCTYSTNANARFWYLVTAARGRSKQTWKLHYADETLAISLAEAIAGLYAEEQICGHESASWDCEGA